MISPLLGNNIRHHLAGEEMETNQNMVSQLCIGLFKFKNIDLTISFLIGFPTVFYAFSVLFEVCTWGM